MPLKDFRKGKSCVGNIAQLIANIKSSFYNHENTLTAFFDVSSAYDNVQYSILIN